MSSTAPSGQPPAENSRPFVGHTQRITCVEYSPDGALLATGSKDGTIRLWNSETGQQVRQLTPARPVHWFSFSSSGRLLAAICAEYRDSGHVFVWDMERSAGDDAPLKKTEYEVDWHRVPFGSYMVAFSTDDAMIAVMTPSRICVEDARTGDIIADISCEDYSFDFLLSFTPNNEKLLFGCNAFQDRDVRSLDLESQRQTKLYLDLASATELESKPAVCSRDGRLIAGILPTSTGGFQIWDAESGQSLHGPLLGHVNMTTSICFSPDGTHVIDASSLVHTMCVWGASTGELEIGPLGNGTSFSFSLIACSPSNSQVACVFDDTVHVWNISTEKTALSSIPDGVSEERPLFMPEETDVIQWLPDGRQFITSSKSNDFIHTWDAQTGALISRFPYNGGSRVALSPDGALLAVGSFSWLGTVVLLDSTTGKEHPPSLLRTGTARIHKLEFAPQGLLLAVVAQDTRRLYLINDVLSDRKIDHVEGTSDIMDFTFSPDAQFIAYACADDISLYHVDTSEVTLRLPVNGAGYNRCLSFSPDGSRLLDNHGDNDVILWELASSRKLVSLPATKDSRVALSAFSPDGRTFLCNYVADSKVKLCMFNASNGKRVWSIGESRSVSAIGFAPGGDRIAVGLEEGPLQVYDAATGQMILPKKELKDATEDLLSDSENQRVRRNLPYLDDESIMNMPVALSGAARSRSQGYQINSSHQPPGKKSSKATENNARTGLFLRLTSRLGFTASSSNGERKHGPIRAFKLISIAKSKARNLAGSDPDNTQSARRNSGSDSSSSSSHSPPVSTQAQPDPHGSADLEETESTVSNHGCLDVVRYCLCCPCGR